MSLSDGARSAGSGRGGRLLVVGALNVDMVVAASRLPGPGETVVGADLQRHGGGKGGNAAVAAVRSGTDVRYVGAVGPDEFGVAALAELRAEGIDVSDVVIKEGSATGAALIVVDPFGENQIAVAAGANAVVGARDVRAAIERASGWPGCVLVSTEISAAAVVEAVEAATAQGWLCVLNPAPVAPGIQELLKLAPIITPNQGELRDLYQLLGEPGDPPAEKMAAAVASHTRAPVVVTLGADGVLLCGADGVSTRIPAWPARRVVDTTGAGDTFNGVFAASLAAGTDVAGAARRGVVAAALSVESAGARTGMPSAATIDAVLATTERRAGT
ncbi:MULTISPECIES: ribokinase [Amycolatopsis]|uniref:Ribokinase n=1 Tax=Amycolatopsis echigonensis TaxID=2576905 RepID=A0A2N3WND8_9PSEU|nr:MULTISPECIES: ribokinase [Amycolatopsis]PKV95373.1 ribokinase [Amycolatopsis niigatensis]